MAGSLVGGAILSASLQVLFDRLAYPSFIDTLWGRQHKKEILVKKLRPALLSAEAVLYNSAARHITNPAVKEWLTELGETVDHARNLLNENADAEGSSQSKSQSTSSRCKKLEIVLDRLEYMARQNDAFSLIELGQHPSIKAPTTSLVQESPVYGRDNDVAAIVQMLLEMPDGVRGDLLRVITVVGVSGIGKTTLSQLVYNDHRVEEHFSLRAWVCVSNGLDIYQLTKVILEAVSLVPCDIKDLNLLQLRLREELCGKRFLLVLDGLNENCTNWEVLRGPFRSCGRGSWIILTTCSESSIEMEHLMPVYHLNPLSDEDCWNLFASHAFASGNFMTDPQLEAICKLEVVKNCKGLPLSAKTLARLLHSKTDPKECIRILTSRMWESQEDINAVLLKLEGANRGRLKPEQRRAKTNSLELEAVTNNHGLVAGQGDKPRIMKRAYAAFHSKRAMLPLFLILWFIVFGILSTQVFRAVNDAATVKRKEALGSICDQQARMLEDQFATNANQIHFLGNLLMEVFYSKNESYGKKMQGFLTAYMTTVTFRYPLLADLVYAERVTNSDQEKFERQHRWKKEKEFEPVQKEHAPIVFYFRAKARIFLHDVLSWKVDQLDILKARETGKLILSSPFRLLQSRHFAFALSYPVYKTQILQNTTLEERIAATAGYLGGAFDFESLVESTLHGIQTVGVSVYDVSNSSDLPLLLYTQQRCNGSEDQSMSHESKLELGDPFRKHKMICRYHERETAPRIAFAMAFLFFMVGLLLGTGLYGAVVYVLKIGQAMLRIEELKGQAEAVDAANLQNGVKLGPVKSQAGLLLMQQEADTVSPQDA